MEIQTLSVVIGSRACDARCPFCVSKMTGFDELKTGRREINEGNFRKACEFAHIGGTTTVLFTGKGEPTLYPEEISRYLELLQNQKFPFIELQTNGLSIGRLIRDGKSNVKGMDLMRLEDWHRAGLNTIAISTVGIRPLLNREIYADDYPVLEETIAGVHRSGFTVRLGVMMVKGGVDVPAEVDTVIKFAQRNNVEQLTFRPIRKPEHTHSDATSAFVTERGINKEQERVVREWVAANGTKIMSLMHDATVYDVDGQNVCMTDALTCRPEGKDIRTLIFYSNGRLAYSWDQPGAVILGGWTGAREEMAAITAIR
ncbi:MAG: radical SAM protein [bacterium]|nr:radical SAM protein [bacterium]